MRRLTIVLISLFAVGCAHGHLKRYDPKTAKKICDVSSWVLGTGNIEQVTNTCGDYAYGTNDTGISNNGKEALRTIAAAASKASMGGAASSVIETIVDAIKDKK